MYGPSIRKAREEAGRDIDSVSKATRIHRSVIEGIENEALEKLPEGVFIRGYLQQLGKELGLELPEIHKLIEDFNLTSGINPPRIQIPADDARHLDQSPLSKVGLVISALLITGGFLAVTLWLGYAKQPDDPPPPVSASSPSEPVPLAESAPLKPPLQPTPDTQSPLANPTGEPAVEPTPTIEEASPPDEATTQQDDPPETIEAPPLPSAPQEETAPDPPRIQTPPSPEAATQPVEEAPNPTLALEVVATAESWIGWVLDGQRRSESLLQAGESVTLSAHEKIEIKSGNAGGLQLKLNGHKLPALGQLGRVRTRIYDQDILRKLIAQQP